MILFDDAGGDCVDGFVGQAIERVVEATEWFIRTPSLRVMHVVTSGLLRNVVLKHLTATELLEANTCPFFVLEAPTEPGDSGWSLRSEELRGDWEALLESAPAPSELAPLWPEVRDQSPLARFGLEVGKALAVLHPPMTGLVIVLAPVWVRDVPRWRDDLAILLDLKHLSRARFIVVDVDEACSMPVIELRALAERVDARIDDDALRKEADASLAALKTAPLGPLLSLVGAAGASVSPPPRRKRQPPFSRAA